MRYLRALAAGALLLLLLVGVPLILAATVGDPLHGWGQLRAGDLSDAVVIDLLAAVAYLAWAQFAIAVLAEAAMSVHGIPWPARPQLPVVFSSQQHLARTLITAAFLAGPTIASTIAPALPASTAAAITTSISTQQASLANPDGVQQPVSAPAQHAPAPSSSAEGTLYTVGTDSPGTFWDLAVTHLGDGERWHEIWALNEGRVQADGTLMHTPGLLRPGWTVLVPAASTDEPAGAAATGDHEVTVRPGDTLSDIGTEHSVPDWHRLWAANQDRVEPGGERFTDPDLIQPGWKITIPGTTAEPLAAPAPQPNNEAHQPPADNPELHPVHHAPPKPPPAPTLNQQPKQDSENEGTEHTTGRTVQADQPEYRSDSPALPIALSGGMALLAGASLTALLRYRRRQFRHRRPGQSITATPPHLQETERAVLATGSTGVADVRWLDDALRGLAYSVMADPAAHLPDVLAVRMTDTELELILTGAAPAPAPWQGDASGTRWRLHRHDTPRLDPAIRELVFAPFPTLVSVGYTESGEHWMLDLERIGAMSLTGEADRCLDLARFMAAELAHNTWSEMLTVTLVGFGSEMAVLNPDRLTYTDDLPGALAEAVTRLASAEQVTTDGSVLDGRIGKSGADALAPHVVLVAPNIAEDPAEIGHLLQEMKRRSGRVCVALILTGAAGEQARTRWSLSVGSDATLHIPDLDLELRAHQIPAEEAAQLAQLMALAAQTDDQPTPDAHGNQPWDAYADAAGNPRETLTTLAAPAPADPADDEAAPSTALSVSSAGRDEPAPVSRVRIAFTDSAEPPRPGSILPLGDQTYLNHTATTTNDVAALAPQISEKIRDGVERADPGLDADLAAWADSESVAPKLRLLGPVTVAAAGPLPQRNPRRAWNNEVVAFLATHAAGVTAEQLGTALWPGDPDIGQKTKVRQAIAVVRKWLGNNPRTGHEFLPAATTTAGAGGIGLYRIEDILIDAELFRRLRLRGVARGADGMNDLQAALDLVTGKPLDQRRPGGYSWLAELPLDHEYTAMIVDVAHILATHYLANDQPEQAAATAQVALLAGSTEDTPLLDLVATCYATNNTSEARSYIQRIMDNHDAEVEEDLPPRTYEVLVRHNWLSDAG